MVETLSGLERKRRVGGDYVELRSGERVPAPVYYSLSRTDQARLQEMGLEAFTQEVEQQRAQPLVEAEVPTVPQEAEQEAVQAEWESRHTQLDTGEWVDKAWYDALPYGARYILKVKGVAYISEALQKRFDATHTQLNTGEWVSKAWYDSLSRPVQLALNVKGVEYIGEALRKRFDATHVQLGTGEWLVKEDYDALDATQQAQVMELGVAAYNALRQAEYDQAQAALAEETAAPTVTGEEAFDQLVQAGEIPSEAEYQGYDPETGEVTYVVPTDWRKLFLSQPPEIQESYIFRQAPYLGFRYWWDLTDKEKEAVLADFSQEYGYLGQVLGMTAEEQRQEASSLVKSAAIGMIPVAGTIYNWDKMSPAWKGVSIAMDVLVVAALFKAVVGAVKAVKAPITTAAARAVKAEQAVTQQLVGKIRSAYGKRAAKAYTNLSKAQSRYVLELARAEQLAARGKTVPTKLHASILLRENKLRSAAQTFSSEVTPKAGFDSPDILKLMTNMPDELVRHTQSLVSGFAPTKVSIKALQTAVTKAEAALKAAQAKYPKDPRKWVDLLYALMKAEARLEQARAGSVAQLYQRLLAARRAGKTAKAARLERELYNTIRRMEIEWGAGGPLSPRGGRVLVGAPTKPLLSPSGTTQLRATSGVGLKTAGGVAVASRLLTVPASTSSEPVTITTPEVITIATSAPKVAGVPESEIIDLSKAAFEAAIEAANSGLTVPQIRAQVSSAVEKVAQTEMKAVTRAQVKAITTTAVKLAAKKATARRRLRLPPSEKAPTRDEERPIVPAGTYAWLMGIGWRWVPPPYTAKKPHFSFKPPRGAKVGGRTPAETIQVINPTGKEPRELSIDLGVTDVFIKGVKNPTIEFRGRGLETDVGTRIPGPETGLSLDDEPGGIMEPIRTRKPKTRRKRRRLSNFEYMTTLKGYKP